MENERTLFISTEHLCIEGHHWLKENLNIEHLNNFTISTFIGSFRYTVEDSKIIIEINNVIPENVSRLEVPISICHILLLARRYNKTAIVLLENGPIYDKYSLINYHRSSLSKLSGVEDYAYLNSDYLDSETYKILSELKIGCSIHVKSEGYENSLTVVKVNNDNNGIVINVFKSNEKETIEKENLIKVIYCIHNNTEKLIFIAKDLVSSFRVPLHSFAKDITKSQTIEKNKDPENTESLKYKGLLIGDDPTRHKDNMKFSAVAHVKDRILMTSTCWYNDSTLCFDSPDMNDFIDVPDVTVTFIGL